MNKIGFGVQPSRLPRPIFHIIGVGNDESRPFRHQIIYQLGNGDPWPVGRVDLVDINHLDTRDLFLHILARFVMGLAPTVIIIRPHQEKAEDEWFVCCPYAHRGAQSH